MCMIEVRLPFIHYIQRLQVKITFYDDNNINFYDTLLHGIQIIQMHVFLKEHFIKKRKEVVLEIDT